MARLPFQHRKRNTRPPQLRAAPCRIDHQARSQEYAMKMTVAKKFALLAGAALLGIMLLAGLGQYQLEAVYEAANYSTVNTVPSLVVLDKLRDGFLRMRIRINQHVLNTDEKKLAEIDATIVDMRKQVESNMKAYET